MILALNSLHSMTRWQHTAMIMRKTKRGSSLDVTTWTHVKETFYENKFTDDSAPTYRWLQFTLWFYFSFLLAGRREWGCGRPLRSELAPGQNKKRRKFRGKTAAQVSLFKVLSGCVGLVTAKYSRAVKEIRGTDDHQMNKYHSRVLRKSFFSVQSRTHWQRLRRMGLNRWRWMTGGRRPSLFLTTCWRDVEGIFFTTDKKVMLAHIKPKCDPLHPSAEAVMPNMKGFNVISFGYV